jgi:hypothetical protein
MPGFQSLVNDKWNEWRQFQQWQQRQNDRNSCTVNDGNIAVPPPSSLLVAIPLLDDQDHSGPAGLARLTGLVGLEFRSTYPQTPTSTDSSLIQMTLDHPIPATSTMPSMPAVFEIPSPCEPSLDAYLQSNHGIIPRLPRILQQTLWDVPFMPIFASGPAVQILLQSKVVDYMEFKCLQGILWCDPTIDGQLVRVPCSKTHVFTSRSLSPLEKRKLMKVLQLVMDYGTTTTTANPDGRSRVLKQQLQHHNHESHNNDVDANADRGRGRGAVTQ